MTLQGETAVTGVDGAADTAEVSAWFSDTRELDSVQVAAVPVGQAGAIVLAAAEEALTGAMTPPACVSIATDEESYLEATFTACTGLGGRVLDGTVRGEVDFETSPCGPFECPTTVLWSMTADLTFGDEGAFAGAWLITAPVDADATRSFEGTTTTVGPHGASIETEAIAIWTEDEAGCVTLDAEATAVSDADALLGITGLVRCPGTCPSAGEVSFEVPRGAIHWTYDGDDTVVVTGTGANMVELALPCEP